MTPKNKTPTTVATVAGARKFQQTKSILLLTLHKFYAIFSMRVLCLGDVLPLVLALLVLAGVEVLK